MASRKSKKSPAKRQVKKLKRATKNTRVYIKVGHYTTEQLQDLIDHGETRDIRSLFQWLRELGLVRSKRDARKIKKGDRNVIAQISKFKDVVTGKAKVVKLSKARAKAYKRAGQPVYGQSVVVKVRKGQVVKRKGKSIFKYESVLGGKVTTVLVPHSMVDMQRNLGLLRNDPEIIDRLNQGYRMSLRFNRGDGEYDFGRIYIPKNGGTIERVFTELQEYVERYESVGTGTAWGALELTLVSKNFHRPPAIQHRRRKRDKLGRERQSTYNRKNYERFRKRNPKAYEAFKRTMRKYQRKRRGTKKANYRTR